MGARAAVVPAQDPVLEVCFPGWPVPAWFARAVAVAAPRPWATQREAGSAAFLVAAFVGVPALLAAGTVIATVAIASVVLLAPLVAVVLACVAWHANRRRPAPVPPPSPPAAGG